MLNAKAFFDEVNRREIRRVYLMHGVEEYAKDRALEALLGTLQPSLLDFNSATMNDPGIQELTASCEALPMMDDRRMIIVRDSRFFSQSEGDVKELIEYLPNLPETTCLCFFIRGECDARRALFKAVSKLGGTVSFERYSEEEAARWAASYAARRGGQLGAAQARKLVSMVGRDLSDVVGEVEKVCNYAEGAEITDEMLDVCVRKNLEYTAFQMLEHFIAGRMAQGFKMLNATLTVEGQGAAISTMMFFASRIRNMLAARYALDKGMSAADAAKCIEGNPYAAKKSVEAARRFTARQLEDALILLADADYDVKRGRAAQDAALIDSVVKIFSPQV